MKTLSGTSPLATIESGKALRIALWIAQLLLVVAFCASGFMKLAMPIPELAAMIKWPGDYPPAFVRFIGVVDLLGGIGILLPSMVRVMPRLAVLAAIGCAVLQVLAMAFHANRGELQVLPVNAVLLGLALFVLWGRIAKAPIAPRQSRV